ncbi:MAG: hypothetical protein J2P21_14265 [Chloracidobacterium sp.]|nr:hypothetical protein [Chloracidobacterium sp.]
MNIGRLISMFVVSCLLTLSLATGANVKAQTPGVNPTTTNPAPVSYQNMSKKKHGKHHHKKNHRQG